MNRSIFGDEVEGFVYDDGQTTPTTKINYGIIFDEETNEPVAVVDQYSMGVEAKFFEDEKFAKMLTEIYKTICETSPDRVFRLELKSNFETTEPTQ